jgi:hypothetical protein
MHSQCGMGSGNNGTVSVSDEINDNVNIGSYVT